jgi:hypothetical protein
MCRHSRSRFAPKLCFGRQIELSGIHGRRTRGRDRGFQTASLATRKADALWARLEQIAFYWNRLAIPIERVNLLYLYDVERIHAFDLDRSAVHKKRDPL